ncbi:hypothetical protein CHOED_020 [Vibrio phage CHOED]|uniref:hypothetical protein n=1 Tax=Vibrio phage CHOED TaxID=1458716 RepID=UPI00042EF269|nr:hypothetical protein CHOED_020 [Vibrio phage CHOED]AHK11880.1 hypothetical protein CHOED_020 [Vibrio phage CHOED]
MQTLPDEMVWWQVKDAIDRGVPDILVAYNGTLKRLTEFIADLGIFLSKKGFYVMHNNMRRFMYVGSLGNSTIHFMHYVNYEDLDEAHGHAGCEYQALISNIPMSFDSVERNQPILYLMSRIRKSYKVK